MPRSRTSSLSIFHTLFEGVTLFIKSTEIKSRSRYIFLILLLGFMTLLQHGCSGCDGNSASVPPNPGAVSIFVTDNVVTDYSAVWVKLINVSATDAKGNMVELFSNPNGEVLNLKKLDNVARLINATRMPDGTYERFSVTLANDIKLIPLAGGEINATIAAGSGSQTISFDGFFKISSNDVSGFAIDFDLQAFTLDVASSRITPAIRYVDPQELLSLSTSYAKLEGRVTRALSEGFAFVLEDNGPEVEVLVETSTVIVGEVSGPTTKDSIQPGVEVDVSGSYDPLSLSMRAMSVVIDDDGNLGDDD